MAASRKRKANNTIDDESKKILDIIKTDYNGARQAIKRSEIKPKNDTNIPYRKLLLYVMTELPDINEPTELENINVFFTRMQEDSQGRPITNLDTNELEQYLDSLQKIYGNNIPNIFYHKETTDKQGVLSVKWTWVLSDMGIAATARYRKNNSSIQPVLNKKLCPYAGACYRKNKEHMKDYAHPNSYSNTGSIWSGGRKTYRTLRKRTLKTRKHRAF
jgi:hypothetical protein